MKLPTAAIAVAANAVLVDPAAKAARVLRAAPDPKVVAVRAVPALAEAGLAVTGGSRAVARVVMIAVRAVKNGPPRSRCRK